MLIGPVVNAGSWLVSQIGQLAATHQPAPANANTLAAQPGSGSSAMALQALSQVGVHVSASSQTQAQALQAFMQNLFSALNAQGTATSGERGSGLQGTARMEQEVHGLIRQNASGDSLSQLQQSFQNLVSASGSSAGHPTLAGFLAAFQRDLPSLGNVGNVLNTQV